MHLKVFLAIVSFQLTAAAILPVIYQKDNRIIATEPVKASLPQNHQFMNSPYYEVIQEQSDVPVKPNHLRDDSIEVEGSLPHSSYDDVIPLQSEVPVEPLKTSDPLREEASLPQDNHIVPSPYDDVTPIQSEVPVEPLMTSDPLREEASLPEDHRIVPSPYDEVIPIQSEVPVEPLMTSDRLRDVLIEVKPYPPQGRMHSPYDEVIPIQSEVPMEPLRTIERLPDDLLEIAATKLGLTDLDLIPSISVLAEVLGTTSREDTIETIRQLLETESGIDLIRAFIADYADEIAATEKPISITADTLEAVAANILSERLQKDLEIARKVFTTPKPELGFFARLSSYLRLFDLFPNNPEISISPVNKEVQEFRPSSHNKHRGNKHHESHHQRNDQMQPNPFDLNIPNSISVSILPSVDTSYPSFLPYRPHPMRDEDQMMEP